METILIIYLCLTGHNAVTAQVQTLRFDNMEQCRAVEAGVKELIGGVTKTTCVSVKGS